MKFVNASILPVCGSNECCRKENVGKLYAGKLHVRFDEGTVAIPLFYSVEEIGAHNMGSRDWGKLNTCGLCTHRRRFGLFLRPLGRIFSRRESVKPKFTIFETILGL